MYHKYTENLWLFMICQMIITMLNKILFLICRQQAINAVKYSYLVLGTGKLVSAKSFFKFFHV